MTSSSSSGKSSFQGKHAIYANWLFYKTNDLTWLIRLSRGLPSDPTKQVRSCGIHANHWMGGTPMQYLSTASARVFLSSKLSNHNTFRQIKNTKQELVREVVRAGGSSNGNKQYLVCQSPHIPTFMAKQHFVCTKRYQTLIKYLFPCSQLGKCMGTSWKSLICSKAARWLSLLPLLRYRLHIHDDEVISNTQDPPSLQAHISNPTPVHRLHIITGND